MQVAQRIPVSSANPGFSVSQLCFSEDIHSCRMNALQLKSVKSCKLDFYFTMLEMLALVHFSIIASIILNCNVIMLAYFLKLHSCNILLVLYLLNSCRELKRSLYTM